jgi:hypothetical protein
VRFAKFYKIHYCLLDSVITHLKRKYKAASLPITQPSDDKCSDSAYSESDKNRNAIEDGQKNRSSSGRGSSKTKIEMRSFARCHRRLSVRRMKSQMVFGMRVGDLTTSRVVVMQVLRL